jgi:methyl-accepting chemotaxis protein
MMSSSTSHNTERSSRSLSGLFTDRKIGSKIAIGFAAVLSLTAILAIMNYSSFGQVADAFTTFDQRVQVVGDVREVDRGFVAYRRFVREYSLTGDDALIGEARKREKVLGESIDQALKAIHDPSRHAEMKKIGDEFEAYVKHFDNMIRMRQEQNKLTDEVLDPLGKEARLKLDMLQSATTSGDGNSARSLLIAETLKQWLLVRLDVNKVLGRNDQAAAAAAEKGFADLKSAMSALKTSIDTDTGRKQVAEIETDIKKYVEAYQRASRDAREIGALVNGEMGKVAGALADHAAAIKTSGIAEQKKIGEQTEKLIASTRTQILIVASGALAVGILLAWLLGRFISRPIVQMSGVMREIAGGNLRIDVTGAERGDEIGEMAKTVEVFKSNALEVLRLKQEQEAVEARAAEQRKREMTKLADDFEGAVGEIVSTVTSASTELEASAGTLTSTAERAQELSTSVAAASEQATANVQSVASATEEMASSITEISRQVQESARIAHDAVDQARKTNDRIGALADAANRIGDVVELINTIAGQTNLLALNATIEAARAGDAGRGFAVVAQEVKALAEQTGKATGEISQQISSMQAATQDSVGAIREIGGTIERMSEIASTIASAVEEQGAATQEISRNVQQAAQGTQQVSSNVTDVQRGATETGTASSQVLSAAQTLSRDSTRLKDEVDRFMATVRAA